MMKETVSCNNCANYDFCHYRIIAFEQGTISWESHLNTVEKLGCACFKTKLPKDWIVLTQEQIKHTTDDNVIEFFVKHNEKVRKIMAEREILDLLVPDCKACDENWHSGCLCLRSTLAEKIAKQLGVEV